MISKNVFNTALSALLPYLAHTELTTERSILFLLFDLKRGFVYISTIFKLTDLFIDTFLFKMYIPTKSYLKKGYKVMYNGSNCDRKSQLSGILTEPLNPRKPDTSFKSHTL